MQGPRLYLQQWYGLFLKRMLSAKRDRLALVTQLLVPIALVLVASLNSWYAATETFPTTIFRSNDPAAKAGSAGKPRGLAEVRIADELGRKLPPGRVGEILIRPLEPGIMMTGYYKMPDATLAATHDLWFHSGDRGYLDSDGYLFFVDRIKESIRRRGENISAYDVETILCTHPGILEAAAIAVPSDLGEDDVMACLVRAPGTALLPEEVIRFCAANMAHFMVPRYLAFLEALPKTASEKVEKYKLQAWAWDNIVAVWDREKTGVKLER